jgi:Domain of unknown function (DUF4388)
VSVALRGNLSDFGIGEVFQLIGQQHKSGVLEVDGASAERIHVSFVEGCVVAAAAVGPHEDAALGDMLVRTGLLAPDRLVALEARVEKEEDSLRRLLLQEEHLAARDVEAIEDLVTRETLFTLLRWSAGSFHFTARNVRVHNPEKGGRPAEQILMDGLRMIDEWRTFDTEATRDEAVFRRAAPFESFRESVRGESPRQLADAQRLYDLLDGRIPVRRAVDLTRLGRFEGARLLTSLRRAGTIEPLAAAELPKAARPDARAKPARLGAFRLLAAALPFAALAAVAWLAQRPPAAPAVGLAPDPLAAARAAGAALTLRNASEAFRFAHGRWPSDLDELTREGWSGAAPMAGAAGSPYPLALGDAGVAVLAPEY